MLSSLYFQLNTVSFSQQLCPFRNAFVEWGFLSRKKGFKSFLTVCESCVRFVLILFTSFRDSKKYLKEMESGNVSPNSKRSCKRRNKIYLDKKVHQLAKKLTGIERMKPTGTLESQGRMILTV